jgi:hypothetical protein
VDSFKILSLILFVITEEVLRASAGILEKNMWKVKKKKKCQKLGLYLW